MSKEMKIMTFLMKTMMTLGMLFLGCALARAQATRTWGAGDGDDFNPCSLTAPCKSLQVAYGQTAAGGQINVINADAIGTVKIDHPITIDASESFAGRLAINGADGIVVAAKPGDEVTLRGLTISGAGSGNNGISFISGGRLQVENCVISGFTKRGIDYESVDSNRLLVKDSIIRENGAAGILVQPLAGGTAKATILHTRMEG